MFSSVFPFFQFLTASCLSSISIYSAAAWTDESYGAGLTDLFSALSELTVSISVPDKST